MNYGRIVPIVVAAGIVIGVVVFSTRSGRKPGEAPGLSDTKTKAAETTMTLAKAATPAKDQKPVDVFFLEEAGSADALKAKAATTGSHGPKVNGTRQVVSARSITSKDDGEFMAPRWSPDGLELLVSKPGYNGLFTVGAQGGGITQVTDRESVGFRGEWDPEGQIVAKNNNGEKQRYNADGTPVDGISIENDNSIVGTFTKDDLVYYRERPGEAARVVSQGEDRYYGGVVSPDGKYIAYNGLHSGIYVQPLDGSSPPVRVGAGSEPTWTPDSSAIVFSYAQDDGHNLVQGDLYYASADGSQVSNLTNGSNAIETHPNISPDGKYIAYESNGQIYVGSLR